MKRKNILLLMSDQQRLDTVSAYGLNRICRTPHIDRLAGEGMKFCQAFTASAICSPSRAGVMTGLYPHHHGVIDNDTDLKPGVPLLSEHLKAAGYYCGYAGKWHISMAKTPGDCGFAGKAFMGYGFPGSGVFPGLRFNAPPEGENDYQRYLTEHGFEIPHISGSFMGDNPNLQVQEMYARHDGPVESTIEYYVAREAIGQIEQAAQGQEPFFIWANFWGPHSPSIVPEPYYSMYHPGDIPEYPGYRDDLSDKPYGHRLCERMWGLGSFGWPGMAEITARYYGHCTMIDDMVGMIVKRLEELGMLEDTVIVYTADHGDCLGAHKLIEKGPFMYDETYRVPLVVYGLGRHDNDSLVYLHELMPSFLELAGIREAVKQPLDGESLLPLMNGEQKDNGREAVYGQFHNHFFISRHRLIRTREYAFVFNENEAGELYDLAQDPYELVNQNNNPEYQEIKNELKQQLLEHLEAVDDPARHWYKRIYLYY